MERHALFVGIDKYASAPLRFAVRDATEMHRVFMGQGSFEAKVLLDAEATRPAILKQVRSVTERSGTRLLYFAGHAALMDHDAMFVPYGADDWTGMISFTEIASLISVGASNSSTVVILDCCHAGALELDARFNTRDFQSAFEKEVYKPNVALLLACGLGQAAREDPHLKQGVFTHVLLQGLAGSAAEDDGKVSLGGLHAYVSRQFEKSSQQRPSYRADLSQRIVLIDSAPLARLVQSRKQQMMHSVQQLKDLIASADEGLAELKPPYQTREQYRISGWTAATKIVLPVAEKRQSIIQRYEAEALHDVDDWSLIKSDVDTLLAEVGNLLVGTHTPEGRVIARVGDGGFGSVFRVESPSGAQLAYKVFHPHQLANTAKVERFRIGYRAMDRIDHPRIVRVSKFVESPLSFYMQFVDGPNLRAWYSSEKDAAELISVLLGVATVVEYAHGVGVLHRDIKPENVLLVWDAGRWVPVLTDFDLAWFSSLTQHTVEAFGAPFYAAPEQLASPGTSVSHQPAVDVYSIGMLGLYLITGRDPVVLDESLATLSEITKSWPSRDAAEKYVALIAECAERRPHLRLATVSLIRDRLIEVQQLLRSSSDPRAEVSPLDFLSAVSNIAGHALSVTQDVPEFVSTTDRTRYSVTWESATVISCVFVKRGQFLAEGLSHEQARSLLAKRIDSRLNMHRQLAAAGVDIKRVGTPMTAGEAKVEIRMTGVRRTLATAGLLARIAGHIVPLYEQL